MESQTLSRPVQAGKVSVLIVNWNTRDLLRVCLRSLEANFGPVQHEVIVVDNDSADGSAPMVRAEFPDVHLIASSQNLGFAAGNNRAYQACDGEWIWLLNPDTEVLDGAASAMVNFLRDNPAAGAVASSLVDAGDGTIQRSCRTFPSPAALWTQALGLAAAFPRSKRFGFYKMGWWNYKSQRRVDQPMASSLLLRRSSIEAAGGLFDESFPIYFNDVDLCYRLWAAGSEIWFLPSARVKHWGGAATGQIKPEMILESHRCMRLYYEKHYRGQLSPLVYWPTVWMFGAAGKLRYLLAKRRPRA